MKKFLSLVLALVMTMSLVTVSAGAKDFTDSGELSGEQYAEAVNVMSEMGIIDGYAGGDFRPQGTLTRQAAAKIIACMILGKTTAESLGTSAAPFKDVPAGSSFAGYIAFCVERGLIDGYADGTFRPTGTLTGFAFLKMLLGALGYDSSIEGYTGPNWTVNVAGRAYEIGLTAGNDEFVGAQACTREQAALYAVNTLKTTLVEYTDRGSEITVNGAVISTAASVPTYVTSSVYNQATSINADRDNSGDYTVEFAERYQPDLSMDRDTDDFGRPSYTWAWKNRDIGTYVDYSLMVAEYTTGVSGRELYNVLTASTIRNADLDVYVDGVEPDEADTIDKSDLSRSNQDDVGVTDNGVLTQVFVDTDANDGDGLITIASINTWLAQATANYSESKEYAPLKVFTGKGGANTTYNVDVEDVANVADVADEAFYLVNISYKDSNRGEVVAIQDAEVMEDSTVTKWSSDDDLVVSKLTTDGTQYEAAAKAYYDDENLYAYDRDLLTDMSYNVYLDQYGYVIGVELYEGTMKYVFITGYDRNSSNLSIRTATAGAIFLDGTMDEIEVNVTDTNKNIEKADMDYFDEWESGKNKGNPTLNRWYTYTVDEDGTYTLKPATMTATLYADENDKSDGYEEVTIDTANVSVKDTVLDKGTRVYGEDDSVFITVEMDKVDTSNVAITDVNGVYTGVQNVDLEIDTSVETIEGDKHYDGASEAVIEAQVYTVYDKDNYIIGAVAVADATGSVANYAYILSGAKSEEKIGDTYYWEFEAILDGQVQTLTAKSKYTSIIDELDKGTVQELRFDADDYVVKVVDVDKLYDYDAATDEDIDIDDYDVYFVNSADARSEELELKLQGRTLYITPGQDDMGLALASDAKAVVIQDENGKSDVKTEFDTVSGAISYLADPDEDTAALEYVGEIVAVLNSNGTAAWVVFDSETELLTGTNRPSDDKEDDTNTSGRITVNVLKDSNAGFAAKEVLAYIDGSGNLMIALPTAHADKLGTLSEADVSVTINGINARVEKDDDASSNGQVVYTVENRNLTDSDRIEITIGDCTYEEFELVVMEDFGPWGEAQPGAYNVGWTYVDDFDTDDITGLEVAILNADGDVIVRYTASASQVEWQKENGYFDTGKNSAPFYQTWNNGDSSTIELEEGRDSDWTVEFGPAFEEWEPATCYVTVTTDYAVSTGTNSLG